jgi:hypothetical protein
VTRHGLARDVLNEKVPGFLYEDFAFPGAPTCLIIIGDAPWIGA